MAKHKKQEQSVLEQATSLQVVRKGTRANRLTRCAALMSNEEEWDIFLNSAKMGASLGTLEARCGMREGTLKEWLEKGKDDSQKVYSVFRKEFLKAVSEARLIAEGTMLAKNPEGWLDRNSAAKVVESELVQVGGTGEKEHKQEVANQLLEALSVLRAQGYDLNEIVDRKGILLGHVVGEVKEG